MKIKLTTILITFFLLAFNNISTKLDSSSLIGLNRKCGDLIQVNLQPEQVQILNFTAISK